MGLNDDSLPMFAIFAACCSCKWEKVIQYKRGFQSNFYVLSRFLIQFILDTIFPVNVATSTFVN